MTTRQERNAGFRKQHILPVIIWNVLLLSVLAVAVCAGLVFYLQNMLNGKLRLSYASIKANAATVDTFLADGCDRAEHYAAILAASGSSTDPAVTPINMLRTFSALENGADIGVADFSGRTTSANGALPNVLNQPFFTSALAGNTTVCIAELNGNRHLVFAAPLTGDQHGVLFLAPDANVLGEAMPESSIFGNTSVLLDSAHAPVACDGALLQGFSYDEVKHTGLLLKPDEHISLLWLIREGRFRLNERLGEIVASDTQLTKAQLDTLAHANSYLTLGVWFEQPLSYNGWRMLSFVNEQLDDLSMRELMLVLLALALLICIPIVTSVAATVSRIVHNRRISKALLYDPVTGGNNFEYFKQEAKRALTAHRNNGKVLAFVAVDVNHFRVFSEVHGHEAGEELLIKMFHRLTKQLRRGELIARNNADEFAMLLILSPSEDPLARVEQATGCLSQLYPEERIRFSTGVYVVNDRSLPVQRMYAFATVAKDAAHHMASSAPVQFDNTMRSRLINEQQIESLMDKALLSKEFVVYLQPKFDTQSHTLSGAEALVRWISPERGFVSPGEFIPLFERNRFILKLDDYMLDHVCALQKSWMDAGRALVPISVNISRANFLRGNVAPRIKKIVDAYGIPHACIELELTESAFFDDQQVLISTVCKLRSYGFSVSMDDFGSGYSSLNSLKNLPLDVIKLDKAFFDDAADVERGVTLIRDTIDMAKHLNMKVVAEGIETEEQVRFLMGTRCDLIQGFYFAKPMSVEEFEKLQP